MPRGEFKHRYWFFADAPNIAGKYKSIIWKDWWWKADSYRLLKYRGGCTIALFELNVWCEKCVAARNYAVIWKQLLISNVRNRVRWVVLGLSEDGAYTDLFKNLSVNSLKGSLSNGTTFSPPLFSLVNTFKSSGCILEAVFSKISLLQYVAFTIIHASCSSYIILKIFLICFKVREEH